MSDETLNPPTLEWISTAILPHEGAVRGWVRRAAPPGLDPDDVIQEAYSRIARLADPSQLRSGKAYFFTVARNVVREYLRRERVVRIDPLGEIEQLSILDDEPSAERVLAARQEFKLVWRTMDQLPERCRRVLLLRRLEGLSQREIAETVGSSKKSVEKQITIALKRLLALLAEDAALHPDATSHETRRPQGRKAAHK